MRIRLYLVAIVVLVLGASGPPRANAAGGPTDRPTGRPTSEPMRGESFVSVILQPDGAPILVVKYPWKRHAKPSVEIRVLEQGEVDNPLIRPLFFMHELMKGEVTAAVYRCQDRSDDLAQTATFSRGKVDIEIFGARNSLGRPAVCAACRILPDEVSAKTKALISELARTGQESLLGLRSGPEIRAAYCLLDAWAVDERTLYLELPASYFPGKSQIRVWLLRDKDIVWTANTTWPGTAE